MLSYEERVDLFRRVDAHGLSVVTARELADALEVRWADGRPPRNDDYELRFRELPEGAAPLVEEIDVAATKRERLAIYRRRSAWVCPSEPLEQLPEVEVVS